MAASTSGSRPALLGEIALHAQDSVQALTLGLAAVGNLWAIASVEIDDGTIPMESVEPFGWMLSILSECSAALLVLGAECQRGRSEESLNCESRGWFGIRAIQA